MGISNLLENIGDRLSGILDRIYQLPALAAPPDVSREENICTKNGKVYRYAYRVQGRRKKSLGKINGEGDLDLLLSIKKRELIAKADRIAALLWQANSLMDEIEREIPLFDPTPSTEKVQAVPPNQEAA